MPVDTEPVDCGNLVLVEPEEPGADLRVVVSGGLEAGPRYKSHFATCPQAESHRVPPKASETDDRGGADASSVRDQFTNGHGDPRRVPMPPPLFRITERPRSTHGLLLCNLRPTVHGALPCPREKGHPGPCYWWTLTELGERRFLVNVYRGEAAAREKVLRGHFTEPPELADVFDYLILMATLRRREQAARQERQAAAA